MNRVEKHKIGGVQPEQIGEQVQRAQSVISKLNSLLSEESGPWLSGSYRPTALDAHVVIFLARLQDVGRASLIPPGLERYSAMAMETSEWQAVMEGRRTMTTL
jgi:glutathione S-transferase